jgi:hypothetical protein
MTNLELFKEDGGRTILQLERSLSILLRLLAGPGPDIHGRSLNLLRLLAVPGDFLTCFVSWHS